MLRNSQPNAFRRLQPLGWLTVIGLSVGSMIWTGGKARLTVPQPFRGTAVVAVSPNPAGPSYWAELYRLEPLLTDAIINPFSEDDFLWFVAEWKEQSYVGSDGYRQRLKVLRHHLASQPEYQDFRRLLELPEQAELVRTETEDEAKRLEINYQSTSNERAFASGFQSGFEGGSLGAQMYSQGSSRGEAVAAAGAYAVVNALVRVYQDQQELGAVKREALGRLTERSKKRLDEIAIREEALRQQLRFRVTLDLSGGTSRGIVLAELERGFSTATMTPSSEEQAKQFIQVVEHLLRLRQRIPHGTMYDAWRAEAAFWAGYYLEHLALNETKGKAWGSIPSKPAALAVRIWDLALQNDPEDVTHFIRAHRACCQALAGDPRAGRETVQDWIGSNAHDHGFAELNVRLRILAGDCGTETVKWLARAVDRRQPGTLFSWTADIPSIRLDPSFSALQQAQSGAVAAVVWPKYEWRWVDGWLNDEVSVTNRSPFPLTNVKITVSFGSEMPPIKQDFTIGSILPEQTMTWKNLNIKAKSSAKDSCQMTCDEQVARVSRK